MSRRMTTVASFDLAPQAQLAKNALEAAGIAVVTADSEIVAMDWLISSAVGGVKVQVWEEDAERAAAVLTEKFGDEAGLASEDLDEDELARQALAEAGDDVEDISEAADEPVPPAPDPEAPAPVDREQYAWRAFVVGWYGVLLCPPVAFYAFYLFLNAAFGTGPLTQLGRIRLAVTAVLILGTLGFNALLLWGLSGGFGRDSGP